jgi:hypothetical protein
MLLETQTGGFVWPDPACLPPGHSPYSPGHARKHGYVAQIDLQGETERNSFYQLEGEFYNEYRPTCATESALLDEVIINYWRMQRVREMESSTLNDESPNPKLLALYFRYRTNFESAFYRALRLLRRVKAENLRLIERFTILRRNHSAATVGFVPQNAEPPGLTPLHPIKVNRGRTLHSQ